MAVVLSFFCFSSSLGEAELERDESFVFYFYFWVIFNFFFVYLAVGAVAWGVKTTDIEGGKGLERTIVFTLYLTLQLFKSIIDENEMKLENKTFPLPSCISLLLLKHIAAPVACGNRLFKMYSRYVHTYLVFFTILLI